MTLDEPVPTLGPDGVARLAYRLVVEGDPPFPETTVYHLDRALRVVRVDHACAEPDGSGCERYVHREFAEYGSRPPLGLVGRSPWLPDSQGVGQLESMTEGPLLALADAWPASLPAAVAPEAGGTTGASAAPFPAGFAIGAFAEAALNRAGGGCLVDVMLFEPAPSGAGDGEVAQEARVVVGRESGASAFRVRLAGTPGGGAPREIVADDGATPAPPCRGGARALLRIDFAAFLARSARLSPSLGDLAAVHASSIDRDGGDGDAGAHRLALLHRPAWAPEERGSYELYAVEWDVRGGVLARAVFEAGEVQVAP